MARKATTTSTAMAAKELGCSIRWVNYLITARQLRADRDERGFWQVYTASVQEEKKARTALGKLRRRKDARIDIDEKRGGARSAHRPKR
jgi:hypothetical protein